MLKNVLLLYKKSAYKIYFLERKDFLKRAGRRFVRERVKKFKTAHQEHYRTLKTVTNVLKEYEVDFTECFRGQNIDYDKYDFIITVGGDGTFLEAARSAKGQVLLGVNSAPSYSTGSFCLANGGNFESIVKKILKNDCMVSFMQRLRIQGGDLPEPIDALNDILVCHENPAMLSRYVIKIKGENEDHKSSGLWVATAAGSSGAIHSAGGRKMEKTDNRIQYMPRELYPRKSRSYKFTGGILPADSRIELTSLMRQGAIYVDGAHVKIPFPYGAVVQARLSPKPIRTISAK